MSFFQLIVLLFILSITLLPAIIALASNKASGIHKIVWAVISFLFSWLGFLVYYFAVTRGRSEHDT